MTHLPFARSRLFFAFASAWAAASFSASLRADDHATARSFRVAGYLPDYRLATFDLDAAAGLTDLMIFSVEPNRDGTLHQDRLAACPWDDLRAFQAAHGVRLILTVGGWGRSNHFASVATSPPKRRTFVNAIVRMAIANHLDGIDLDWEHPANAIEAQAYGDLLVDLRSALDPHGLMLTVTVAAWQQLPPKAIGAVDAVQLMAYDHADQHATFQQTQSDVRVMIDAGVPAAKIVLGLPFYGRDRRNRNATAYRNLVADFDPSPDTDHVLGIDFNGPETIRRKVQYAIETGLGGVMVWEISQDASGQSSLLRVIQETIREPSG